MKKFQEFVYKKLFVMLLALCSFEIGLYASQNPSARMDTNGNGVAVWINKNGSVFSIYASSYIGGSWSTPTLLSNATSNADLPRLAISRTTGNAVVVWYNVSLSGVNSIQASQYQFSSGIWSIPVTLSQTSMPFDDHQVDISEDAPNDIVVIWTEINGTQFTLYTANAPIGGTWSITSH